MAINARREALFERVIHDRLRWVRCAIETVHHRHNVSAILRTCDSLGIHTVDLVGVETFKPSKGAARGADRWLDVRVHADAASAIETIRREGYSLWVADLADPPTAPEGVPLDKPICLWFGAELLGVSDEARAAADGVVTVPMRGFSQSLNVSVAAALTLHTVAERSRVAHGHQAHLNPAERQHWLAWWNDRDIEADNAARHRADAQLAAAERFARKG